jgi:hypothetical protein
MGNMDRECADYRLPDLASTGTGRSAELHQCTWFLYFTGFVIKRLKPIRSNAYPATTMSLTTPILSHSTAAVLYGPRDIRITDRRICTPTQGQVQVKIVSTGLCGSDRMTRLSPSFFL